MPTVAEEYTQYKLLARDYENYGSTDYFLNHQNSQKEVRQFCIRLSVYSFVKFATLCEFLGDTKQTFGRVCMESSMSQVWDSLAARSSDSAKHMDEVFSKNLAAEGFCVDENGYLQPLFADDAEDKGQDAKNSGRVVNLGDSRSKAGEA